MLDRPFRPTGVSALAATLLAVSGASAQQAAPRDATARELARRLPALMESAEIPGLAAAFVRDGEVAWLGSFGVRSRESGAPVTRTTVFQAASLSKPVFAYAVMRLVERGHLELDRPLADYRPHPRLGHEPRSRTITARMVMSHSTGLPNWGGDTLDLAFDPGTGFGYSGEGYVYLQQVVEEITGRPLEEVVRREVFEPLGMERSSFVWRPRFAGDVALGHDALGRAGELQRRDEANAAASLLTTAGDYGRFVAAVLSGTGLEAETHRQMLEPQVRAEVSHASEEENAQIRWALGWGAHRSDPRSLWHWGDNGDHEAFVAAFPERGRGIVYFANSTHGMSIAEEVTRLVSGARHWGPAWAGYERHDDPARVARRGLLEELRTSGREAGMARLRAVRERSPELFDEEMATRLAFLLHQAELDAAAVAVLEEAAEALPASSAVREDLAEALMASGRFGAARDVLKGLAASSDEEAAERYRNQVAWVEARLEARREPVDVEPRQLRSYAGVYGQRRVTLEDSKLFYRREGNRRFRLVALDRHTFRLVGLETFRLRFVTDGSGPAAKVVGLYYDGRRDESVRDGS